MIAICDILESIDTSVKNLTRLYPDIHFKHKCKPIYDLFMIVGTTLLVGGKLLTGKSRCCLAESRNQNDNRYL